MTQSQQTSNFNWNLLIQASEQMSGKYSAGRLGSLHSTNGAQTTACLSPLLSPFASSACPSGEYSPHVPAVTRGSFFYLLVVGVMKARTLRRLLLIFLFFLEL